MIEHRSEVTEQQTSSSASVFQSMAYQQPGGYAQPGGAPQWGAVPGGAQMAGYGAASGGYGAPQPGPAYGAPQGAYGAPDPQLAAYFRAVDRDGSGRISAMELSQVGVVFIPTLCARCVALGVILTLHSCPSCPTLKGPLKRPLATIQPRNNIRDDSYV